MFGEEAALALEVGLHVVVIVEVVSGEIRPHRHIKLEARHPVLAEGVGGDLQGRSHRSNAHGALEHRRHIRCLGCRALPRNLNISGKAAPERTDKGRRLACRLHEKADEVRGRALAVGSGDRKELELALRIPGQHPGCTRHRRAWVLDRDPREVDGLSWRTIGQDGSRTGGNRLLQIVETMRVLSG